jgi:N-terminal domain of anti-restriction factor ArdC
MPTVPEIITESVLKQLEQGVAPWRKPWSTSIPQNLISKKPYRGLNVFLLATQGYGSPYWLTFNQAKQLGAHVRPTCRRTRQSFFEASIKHKVSAGCVAHGREISHRIATQKGLCKAPDFARHSKALSNRMRDRASGRTEVSALCLRAPR